MRGTLGSDTVTMGGFTVPSQTFCNYPLILIYIFPPSLTSSVTSEYWRNDNWSRKRPGVGSDGLGLRSPCKHTGPAFLAGRYQRQSTKQSRNVVLASTRSQSPHWNIFVLWRSFHPRRHELDAFQWRDRIHQSCIDTFLLAIRFIQ